MVELPSTQLFSVQTITTLYSWLSCDVRRTGCGQTARGSSHYFLLIFFYSLMGKRILGLEHSQSFTTNGRSGSSVLTIHKYNICNRNNSDDIARLDCPNFLPPTGRSEQK